MPPTVLVRRPGPRLPDGLVDNTERVEVDVDLALQQWHGYVEAVRAAGWDVVEVPPADDCPDAVFIEDTVVMFGDRAVITRPGAPSRQPEVAGTKDVLAARGLEVRSIEAPGTLEGGDVLKVGSTVYVGRSARTNDAGIEQLRQFVVSRGYEVVAVDVVGVLHLKTAVTALPDGTIIGAPDHVRDPAAFGEVVAVPELEGTAVVVLDERTVLLSAAAPKTAAMLRARGLEIVPVDITEFEKLEGCVTCLSVRLRTA